MKFVLVLLACLVAVPALAQAPIPKALTDAKTAYLVNDGAGEGTFNDLATELQRWGRFQLVDEIAASDITITLGGLKAFKGWPLTVTRTSDRAPLWTAKAKKGLMGIGDNVATGLVKKLRTHIEGEQWVEANKGKL